MHIYYICMYIFICRERSVPSFSNQEEREVQRKDLHRELKFPFRVSSTFSPAKINSENFKKSENKIDYYYD